MRLTSGKPLRADKTSSASKQSAAGMRPGQAPSAATADGALQIEYIEIGRLRPFARNARTHSRKQIRQIADSILAFGFTNPILVDEEKTVLAGHGRLEAAKTLDMKHVPCVRLA